MLWNCLTCQKTVISISWMDVNTNSERFITTSDDQGIVSKEHRSLLYRLLLAALTFPKWK